MRRVPIRHLAATALLFAASSYPAAAGGWGCGGLFNGCGMSYAATSCGGCGATVAYAPMTVYQPQTVYTPRTVYTASTVYTAATTYMPTVPYEQSYVVDQGPTYMPPAATYRQASYSYDEPRDYGYVGRGYDSYRYGGPRYGARWGYRSHGWRHHDRWQRRGFYGGGMRHAMQGGWRHHVGHYRGYGPGPMHHMRGGTMRRHLPMLPLK
jgi:hypothetical protein